FPSQPAGGRARRPGLDLPAVRPARRVAATGLCDRRLGGRPPQRPRRPGLDHPRAGRGQTNVRLCTIRAAVLLALLALTGAGHAATLTATPATIGGVLVRARGGDVLKLAP